MAERSFKKEVAQLKLGNGDLFEGEGILAVTKALLQSGVSYVGGYEGAPVSHLIDVLSDAGDYLSDLGVHVENCANEASAAAMLSASINYPIRGAITFKSIVGTNVASDALSNLASAGVAGGAVIVIGEDYGEGSSIIQERSHAFAMKSQMWLLDPRPGLDHIVNMVEEAFGLSEASNTPVMLELRIRACHMTGSFRTKKNIKPKISTISKLQSSVFEPDKVSLPPATYTQEKLKIDVRWPEAIKYIQDRRLNEFFAGPLDSVGMVVQGGLYNGVMRALETLGLVDNDGNSKIPLYVLNVTYPLVPNEIEKFCRDKKNILVIEEGQPAFLEQAINALCHELNLTTSISGKDCFPLAGEYIGFIMLQGIGKFTAQHIHAVVGNAPLETIDYIQSIKKQAAALLGNPVPPRFPTFCTGCPERPVFSALKLLQDDIGPLHISADIGCHSFATLEPFFAGNTILGYGMGLASSAGLSPLMEKPVISIGGDGGFWHSSLTAGVASYVFNKGNGILVLLKNGYASATGHQNIPSSGVNFKDQVVDMSIESALRGVGVNWIETIPSYKVGKMIKALKRAVKDDSKGLRVIIADGECALAKQRRIKPLNAKKLKLGKRVVKTKFGVDEDTCSGDHSCIRLSGCPSLTIKENPDPLRLDPVTTVNNSCIGCGNCGEVAHAAVLCPSFYRVEIIQNPSFYDSLLHFLRKSFIELMQGGRPENSHEHS